MKPISFVICLFSMNVFGQDISLSELKAPVSPGFTILGKIPSEISRPKTYKDLELSLYNSFTDNNQFIVPKNLALEFSPYWLFKHKSLDYTSFVQPSFSQSIAFNSSISVATIDKTSRIDSNLTFTSMGIGYRTKLISGKYLDNQDEILKKITLDQALIVGANSLIESIIDTNNLSDNKALVKHLKSFKISDVPASLNVDGKKLIAYINSFYLPEIENGNKVNTSEALIDLVHSITDSENQVLNNVNFNAKHLSDGYQDRYGFQLEFATALVLDFPTDKLEFSTVPKFAFWLTPSYRWEDKNMEFLGVIRYLRNEIPEDFSNNFDTGIKFVYDIKDFSIYGEFLHRFQAETLNSEQTDQGSTVKTIEIKTDLKATLNFDYKISGNLLLSFSFGQDFDVNTEFSGNLISNLSLNYGLGGPKLDTSTSKFK